jgi:hypothetical protein
VDAFRRSNLDVAIARQRAELNRAKQLELIA